MRGARILLLRITHLPYVAAIWAYEKANRLLRHSAADDNWLSTSHVRERRRPAFANNPLSPTTHKPHKAAPISHRSDNPFAQTPKADAPSIAGGNDLTDMKQMIAKLSRQVDELTWQLDQHR